VRTIKIKGMQCSHCVKAVEGALGEIEGVSDIRVDLKKGEASFEEVRPVPLSILARQIEKAGYELG